MAPKETFRGFFLRPHAQNWSAPGERHSCRGTDIRRSEKPVFRSALCLSPGVDRTANVCPPAHHRTGTDMGAYIETGRSRPRRAVSGGPWRGLARQELSQTAETGTFRGSRSRTTRYSTEVETASKSARKFQ